MKSTLKPAWALTAKETEAKCRDDEEREVESLLDFARYLNFEKYIEDAEIQVITTPCRFVSYRIIALRPPFPFITLIPSIDIPRKIVYSHVKH